jgi:hypothetical protein
VDDVSDVLKAVWFSEPKEKKKKKKKEEKRPSSVLSAVV